MKGKKTAVLSISVLLLACAALGLGLLQLPEDGGNTPEPAVSLSGETAEAPVTLPDREDEPAMPEETRSSAAPEEEKISAAAAKESAETLARREMKRLYDMGVLNWEMPAGGEVRSFSENEEGFSGENFGREKKERVYVYFSFPDAFVSTTVDSAAGKLLSFGVQMCGQEGDPVLPDREPVDFGTGLVPYYDVFDKILREDMTADELCKLLNEFWGFDGYTLSGTKDEMYGYDTPVPAGELRIKELGFAPYLTVFFDGDEPGCPRFVEVLYYPGVTYVGAGEGHTVG